MSLSPYRQGKARDLYNIFNVFNAASWQFLTGNIITLFALRMGATSSYIGLLSAVMYFAFFFLPFGKFLAKHFSMVRIFSICWGSRSLGMIFLIFAPIAFAAGRHDTALLLTLIGVTIFHSIRGIGMIANNPILSHLSEGPDRGSYMTQVQIIQSAVGMFAGFIIAMLLGRDPPLFIYVIIISVGIASGVTSGFVVSKIPGPEREEGVKSRGIIEIYKETMAEPALRRFIFILIMVALVSGVSRTFIVVYSREVFHQSDGMVSLYAVFGGLGFLIGGLLIKFLIDRIGAKPLFSFCVVMGFLTMVPVIFFPASMYYNFTTLTLSLAFIFFMLNFSWLGAEGVMQTYFLGMVPPSKIMDMGVPYFLSFGMAGVTGSLLSGLLLDAATTIFGSQFISFRILFGVLLAITAAALLLMRKLVPLGALPFKGALEVMFSYRELKAISLLGKLDKTSDSGKEEAILGALYNAPSQLAISGLLTRLKSPRLSVRMESLRTIDALKTLTGDVERALMEDIIHNPYTTAHRSARILGNHKVFSADALFRELATSSDYMLAGEAILALAKLGDKAFRPQIEQIIMETQNPRLKIMGVQAFGIYGLPDSLPLLLDILRGDSPPPYLRDEVTLSMASVLGIQNKFYSLLTRILTDRTMATTLALDEAESAYEYYMSVHGRKRNKKDEGLTALAQLAKNLQSAVTEYAKDANGAAFSRWILELPEHLVQPIAQTVFSEAVLDASFTKQYRLHLLIVCWATQKFRLWTDKLKKEER